MKQTSKILFLALVLGLILFTPAAGKSQKGFVTRSKDDYYRLASGQVLKGRQVIEGKTYYFDKATGKQFHGWKKIGKGYFCFSQGRKDKGSLITTGTPNGFSIGKKGKAILKTEGEKERMKAMAYVSSLLHEKTRSAWSKRKKLRALYDYASTLPYLYDETDKTAAQCVLKFQKQVDGDCADTNSFLAFAGALLGYTSYVVDDYGHWWALLNGKVCDTNNCLFLCPMDQALNTWPYDARQMIRADSPYAGQVMMTIYPDLHGYDIYSLTIYDDP